MIQSLGLGDTHSLNKVATDIQNSSLYYITTTIHC